MDADWYVDPLGRFDGRFFDGERWTERVSEDGALVIDHDFLTLDQAEGHDAPAAPDRDEFVSGAPAVARVEVGRHLQASLIEESPARVVAVLDESTARKPAEPAPARPRERSGRTPIVWGLLALIAALVVAALVLIGNDDSPAGVAAEPVDLDREQEARVEDLESGGTIAESPNELVEDLEVDAPTGAVAPGSSFDPAEAVDVGGLRIVNGESMLADLREWHLGFAAERGIELAPTASCWFGQLGGAAVQVAHCGPVGGSEDSEYLFDSVPLLFEETTGGQIAQPVVDAVMIDAVLANALTLVGGDGDAPPLALQETRGERSVDADADPDGGG